MLVLGAMCFFAISSAFGISQREPYSSLPLPPNSKLLKDVERNEMPNWIREQICDLEYDEDIANKVVDALSGYRRKGLMEVSEENLRKALANEFSASADCIAIAQSLYNRIQKDIAQPQPVSWQRLVLVVARVCFVLSCF